MNITKIRPYGRIYDISHICKDISLTEIAVYGYLCFLSGSSGSCFPSQQRMAADLHIKWDALSSALSHLANADIVAINKRAGANRRKWSYSYSLQDPKSKTMRYGKITERMIRKCADLSCGAIGLWFYLTAVTGTRDDITCNRAALAKTLNVSVNTLRKYIKELEAAEELSTFREIGQDTPCTMFIVRPTVKIPDVKKPEGTLVSTKPIVLSNLTPKALDATKQSKINRETYLSVEGCTNPTEAINKQAKIRRELQEIYHCSDTLAPQTDATYEDVAPRLQRFVREGASRAEILRVVKTDLRYLLVFLRRFPRSWVADPLIRSAALEVIFGVSPYTTTKTVMDQLFWILGVPGEEQSRLLSHLDDILSGSKDARTWLSSLVGRASAALATRPIQHPAAYVRRLILNWLTDRHAQTVDLISYQTDNDLSEIPAPIPQTFDDLVADPLCDDYRPQIRKLSRQDYRNRANAYEAIVREREEAGDPISRYDIWTDDEIVATYAVMPDTYLGFLQMIKDDEIIHTVTKTEIEKRSIAYRLLTPQDRMRVLQDRSLCWILDPAFEEEAI